MLRNHGLLTVAETVADAFLYMYFFETACAIQVRAQAGGELIPLEPEIIAGVKARWTEVTKGAVGALAWPALRRKLDRLDPSYQS
jgi:ribulose-5-phosphate 4-epimerase/fuculose-1-phosphate aldolase